MSLYLHLLFLFSGVLFTLAALAWNYRTVSTCAQTLCLFLAAEGLTCLSYGMNLASSALDSKLFWNHAEYLFGLPVAPLMPVLALRVTGYERRLSIWVLALLFGVPALGVALNWTSGSHGLLYARVWLEQVGGLTVLAKSHGPLYAPLFADAYALIFAACALFAVRQSRRRCLTLDQSTLVGAALLAPLVLGTPYYWLNVPGLHRVNTVHAGFFVTALLFSVALLRGRLVGVLRALGQAQARNELLLAHANAIFYTIAPDGRFSYVSDAWQTFLGHKAQEMVGCAYRDVVLAEDVPACDAFLADAVRSGELSTGAEYRVRHQDGSIRWHTSSIKPVLDWRGRPVTFVGVAHDITAVKRTQEELRAVNERLRQLIASREAELREAVAGALTASEGEARRIGREIHDGLCQELVGLLRLAEGLTQRAASEEPKAALQRLAQQTAHALWLARGISYDLTLHDMELLSLEDALALFAKRFEQASGVEIEVNCVKEREAFVSQAEGHIYRFVREAVVNALRHGQARHIWIDVVREVGQLITSVTNDGAALPGPSELKPGLGLAQMRMRARQVGGSFVLRTNARGETVAELSVPNKARKIQNDE